MKSDGLIKALGDIDDELIDDSEKKHAGTAWVKWGTLAAAFVLVAAMCVPALFAKRTTPRVSDGAAGRAKDGVYGGASFGEGDFPESIVYDGAESDVRDSGSIFPESESGGEDVLVGRSPAATSPWVWLLPVVGVFALVVAGVCVLRKT